MIKNIVNLLKIEHTYREYLISRNVEFNDMGNPLFDESMFITEYPDVIVPYTCRNNKKLVENSEKTAICFFMGDSLLYPRLEKVFKDIDEYRRFMAVVGMDLTFTPDMETELQQLIITINQLFMMILAINGIKIILNTRSGSVEFASVFGNIPKRVVVSSGFLGCDGLQETNMSYLSKILFLFPSKICIYGKHDHVAEQQLERLGFEYKHYDDVHMRTRNKEVNYG